MQNKTLTSMTNPDSFEQQNCVCEYLTRNGYRLYKDIDRELAKDVLQWRKLFLNQLDGELDLNLFRLLEQRIS